MKWNAVTEKREGSALLIALMVLAGLSILGLSLMLTADTEMQISNDERLRKQALYAAEAGIEHALIFMRGVDTEWYGFNGGQPGLLTGNNAFDAPTQPPDNLNSYNDSIVKNENLYDPATPWKTPALARKGNILYFLDTFFKSGSTKPQNQYALRDIPFEQVAGTGGGGAFDVGTYKSRYTVYVKNNLDDETNSDPLLGSSPDQYEYDVDKKLVLTAEGIVDVGTKGSADGKGYKVVRTVQVSIRTGETIFYDDYAGAGGHGGTGNRTNNDEIAEIDVTSMSGMVKRNESW